MEEIWNRKWFPTAVVTDARFESSFYKNNEEKKNGSLLPHEWAKTTKKKSVWTSCRGCVPRFLRFSPYILMRIPGCSGLKPARARDSKAFQYFGVWRVWFDTFARASGSKFQAGKNTATKQQQKKKKRRQVEKRPLYVCVYVRVRERMYVRMCVSVLLWRSFK